MKPLETLITATKALKTNKVRSFLTMLGVIIGVFAVVSMVSLVKGVQNYVQQQFDSLGSNLIFVMPGRMSPGSDPAMSFSNNKLSMKNITTIKEEVGDALVGISPLINISQNIKYKGKNYYAQFSGSNVDYKELMTVEFSSGRFFTKAELNGGERYIIIGSNVKKNLFGDSNAIGKVVQVDGKSFTVIGVMKQRSQDYDEGAVIPYTTMKDTLGVDKVSYIIARLKPNINMDEYAKKVEVALYRDLKKDDFSIMTQDQLLNSFQSILGILAIGLASVAGISLLVGGIGIMNIMLVSVTERTSEIGLRKALGATKSNIRSQFVTEAVMLSTAGGLVGLFLGWCVTIYAQKYFPAQIPWWAIIVAFGFSLAVGVIFGTYPAVKASKLDPIEALRYE